MTRHNRSFTKGLAYIFTQGLVVLFLIFVTSQLSFIWVVFAIIAIIASIFNLANVLHEYIVYEPGETIYD